MENKKTTELLDLLQKLSEEKGDWKDGGKHDQIMKELVTRYPFFDILNEEYDRSLPAIWEAVEEIQEDIKKLERHKHDEKTDDVLIRI